MTGSGIRGIDLDPACDARDRARGALLGLACGDAVGTTVEFAAPGSFEPLTDMVGGGPFHLQAGQWTDDTSMALCLAESIVDTGQLDPADQLRRYVRWWRQGYLSSTGQCFDIGGTTRSALARFERKGEVVDPIVDQESAANGSLMRLAPVPILWHRDLDLAVEASGASSRTTHPAARPVDCCRVMGAMVAALVAGVSWDDVTEPSFWRWAPLHPQVQDIVDGSYRHKDPPAIRGTGFCIDALEAALWSVDGATGFADAILRAANLGDDADTTAAIAGQLAGARWGSTAIPAPWLGRLTMGTRITSLADTLFDLRADPADRPERWPYDELVHAWWVQPGCVLAGEYPGSPKAAGTKLSVLLDARIRTFLDLTTPEDGLTPYRRQLMAMAETRGLEVRHVSLPIPDVSITTLERYRAMVHLIETEVDAGRSVYVHCWGGVGRTGTVVGCFLAQDHPDHPSVLAAIADLRAGTKKAHRSAPETKEQEQMIATWMEEQQAHD